MSDFGADRCAECGSCTDVCPSARHGGIIPEDVVKAFNEGRESPDIWKCLQCHRCNAQCPEDIDVAGIICHLRNEASEKGDVPERFKRTGQQMSKGLKVFPIIGRTEAQRTEMGLTTDHLTDEETAEVKNILKEAGFDYE